MATLEAHRKFNLKVGSWAAIVVGGKLIAQEALGNVAPEDALPVALRRRMGVLERLAARCTLGVLSAQDMTDHLVFCSRYGNVETLCVLLNSIVAREPMSPMAFSGSVHNAAPGLVGQICKKRLNHTALAAGRRTFVAGLTEGYALLVEDGCRDVTVMFADVTLPDTHRRFEDEEQPGVAMALRLTLSRSGEKEAAVTVMQGRMGVLGVLEGLKAGVSQIALDDASWEKLDPNVAI